MRQSVSEPTLGRTPLPSPALKPLLAALAGERQPTPPLWLMRQAGRYLPEYRAIRERAAKSFLDFCYSPASPPKRPCSRSAASASTPRSCSPTFSSSPTRSASASRSRKAKARGSSRSRPPPISPRSGTKPTGRELAPVFETLARVKAALPDDVALIGFCGAPWTVASYMIAGRGTPDQAPARLFAYRHPRPVRGADRHAGRSLGRISRAAIARRRRGGCRFSIPGRASCRRPSSSAGASRRSRASSPSSAPPCLRRRSSPSRAARRPSSANSPRRRPGGDRPRHCGRAARRRRGAAGALRAAGQSRSAGADRRRTRARRGDRPRADRASPAAPMFSTSATAFCPRRRSPMSSASSRACAPPAERGAAPAPWTSSRIASASPRRGSRRCSYSSDRGDGGARRRVSAGRRRARRRAASWSSRGRASIAPARRAAAGGWRCCAGACSRRWASISRPSYGAFPPEFAKPDSGRGDRRALLGRRRVGDRPSLEPATCRPRT